VLCLLAGPHLEERPDDRIREGRAVGPEALEVRRGEALHIAHVHEAVDDPPIEGDGADGVPGQVVDVEQLGALEDAAAPALVERAKRVMGGCRCSRHPLCS
jgi:hypothetical protein